MNRAPSSTVSSVGIPTASQAIWSSSPYAGAMWTTPVPSSVVTCSAAITWNAFSVPHSSVSAKKPNSGV